MIVESNSEISWLIDNLNKLVLALKSTKPNDRLIKDVDEFYKTIVVPWYERYKFLQQESETAEDEEIKNQILDLSNRLTKNLKKK